ncbi:MAG: helix-hairpin-helix domain-containing protein, partial [Candidatus Saccharimonadales bacterium]
EHYASKGALDIDTLGEKNVVSLVEAGLVSDIADIYGLQYEQLLGLDRFADISARKMIEAIAARRQPELPRFIYGLGIRHVGAQTAIDLAEAFQSINALAAATFEELQEVDGIGMVVAESITAWFADPDNLELLQKFASYSVVPHYQSRAGGALSGKNFAVTGSLESMGRDQAAERIRALGGIFQSSLGKDTSYLVVGANVGAAKLTKAAKYGTTQLTEADFLKLIS